jgi:pantoate--beta-alanine ligase
MLEVLTSIEELRAALASVRTGARQIGLVPTMGALHAGHRRLLDTARAENDVIVATIFVNPTQFDRKDDLGRYPRPFEEDLSICREAGVDIVFAPSDATMYPQEQLAWVEVPKLGEYLCGAHRPGHFRGVATVVMKLFQIVQPHRAYFGQKDAQQLAIIQRMVEDLNVPVQIVPVPTVREPDGLALSSRNKHLDARQRAVAPVLARALFAAEKAIAAGETSVSNIQATVGPLFAASPDVRLEYFSIVDPKTLEPVQRVSGLVLIAAAMYVGTTRLIDNVFCRP